MVVGDYSKILFSSCRKQGDRSKLLKWFTTGTYLIFLIESVVLQNFLSVYTFQPSCRFKLWSQVIEGWDEKHTRPVLYTFVIPIHLHAISYMNLLRSL